MSKTKILVGEQVINLVELEDENGVKIPAGSRLRVVSIAAKVIIMRQKAKEQPERYDLKEHFFNAVRADQESDYGNRIRANFVTIKRYEYVPRSRKKHESSIQ